ncbi:PqiC family protein [Salinicola avicenniae]|uniref:PqiC family protein n=1 Tax=Salinicola avicenniae TaxID=2916836 RepID=UPI002073C7ED|nr:MULTISPECIES: ABC-type transport auxiliary lipoprotein family protein [unclassified Salinicola]
MIHPTLPQPVDSRSRPRRPLAGVACLLAIAGSLVLTGCAGSTSTASRYTLPEPSAALAQTDANPTVRQLQVMPVDVASYLDQEGIVMQLSDIELTTANQNLWAEDLGNQLSRRLRQTLAMFLPETTILGPGAPATDALRLAVDVDQFQGRYDGQAVISGEWQLQQGNRLVEQRHFAVLEPLEDDGYPALVRALGQAWERLGATIGEAVVSTPASAD